MFDNLKITPKERKKIRIQEKEKKERKEAMNE